MYISGQESRIPDRFLEVHFDHQISVCNGANEACPFFPRGLSMLNWAFEGLRRPTWTRMRSGAPDFVHHLREVRETAARCVKPLPDLADVRYDPLWAQRVTD